MGAVNLELVGGASLPPATCMFCATNPRDENDRGLPFVEAVGMDINWGETPYICWTCAGIIADLVDRPSKDKVDAVFRGAKLQKKENTRVRAVNDELKSIVQGLMDGKDVSKKAKELMEDG